MPGPFLTIMFADLAGPEWLLARDGEAAAREVLRAHRTAVAQAVERHGGRVVRVLGDGLFATFDSATAAVRCAVEMQTAAAEAALELRVGLDAGEPLLEDGEPQGTPVVAASRLCDTAEAGEILAGEIVRAVAAPHVAVPIRPRGPLRLRGLAEPVGVAQVVWRDDDAAQLPAPAAPPQRRISVVVADDQRLLRAGFRVILDAEPDINVVGEAADGRAAVDVVLRRHPDVVLMDIRMPELDGLDAAERILSEPGVETAVVMLTTFDASEYVYRALRIGASGFLLKDTPSDRLLDAVRVAAAGDALIAPSITRRLVERFGAGVRDPASIPGLAELTPRELDVLHLIARGLSNGEIARKLVVGDNTVKTHVARVLAKLGLRDRVQAVVLAYECGLVAPGQQPASG
ncbi:MAG TPA: response regulator [Solirubrobacteraceae bacterium]|nr:response regulator [Solirubrobacteraceae bacterium]